MTMKSVLMVGGPSSGKSNYLARLWAALDGQEGSLIAPTMPNRIAYVRSLVAFLEQAKFVPKSDPSIENPGHDLSIVVAKKSAPENATEILIPDVLGEVWKKAVATSELPFDWYERLKGASGALLFVRVHSEENCPALDAVNSQKLIRAVGHDPTKINEIPTQVALAELLRILEDNLTREHGRPRVAVVVSAWDKLSDGEQDAGPLMYLANEFPLFAGRLKDEHRVDVRVFGLSVLGGDVVDEQFRQDILANGIQGRGYTVCDDGIRLADVTVPLQWILGN